MKLKETIMGMIIGAVLFLICNQIGYKNAIIDAIPGMLILLIIGLAGILVAKVIPVKIPAVAYIVVLGCIVTYPSFPGAAALTAYINKVSFLSLTAPILAYAGISIGKDLDVFAKSGWRIVVLSCFIFIGTYLGSALIAEIVMQAMGQI